jgi:hypothetical protein
LVLHAGYAGEFGGLDVIAYYSGWRTVLAFAGCLNILSMHGSCVSMLDLLLPWLVMLAALVAGCLAVLAGSSVSIGGYAVWLVCLADWLSLLDTL